MTNFRTELSKDYQKYKKPAIDRRRTWAHSVLGNLCATCGSSDNLEFDHIDRSSKSFNIGSNLLKYKHELLEELKKCQLLCHSCHAEKTKQESQALYSGPRPETKHGSFTMYTHHKCRCEDCVTFNRAYHQQYRERKRLERLKES